MTTWPRNPTLCEINTWAWLGQLSREAGRRVTLDSVPDAEIERLAALGFDGVWLMGVWQRSDESRRMAREHPGLQNDYRKAVPDFTQGDVVGSPFSVAAYRVDPVLGGDAALSTLRQRLAERGIRLVLDFVPNHLARDHAWTSEHPEWLVQGDPELIAREPHNYFAVDAADRRRIYAHGRDPHFSGWTDTVQVDYRSAGARRAMADVLLSIAERCDGARCDMAMLVTRDVFLRTWGREFDPPRAEFWPAAVTDVRAQHPGFLLLAEVYWDLEWDLLEQGFNYAYDKRLYDRLIESDATKVRQHLAAGLDYQRRLARFTENHDESRAVCAFGAERSLAAAALTYTLPGLRLFHEGQLDGWQTKLPVQLGRRAAEPAKPEVAAFFQRLLAALRHPIFRDGDWQPLEPVAAEAGDDSYRRIVAHRWSLGEAHRLVCVNLSPERARAQVAAGIPELAGRKRRIVDLLAEPARAGSGDTLATDLLVDLPGYGYHAFDVRAE